MRVVFSDESGVGSPKKEPITVVTAVVLNMDRQWEPVSNGLYTVLNDARAKHKGLLDEGRSLKGRNLYSAIRRNIQPAKDILSAVLRLVVDLGDNNPGPGPLVYYGAVDRTEFENYRGLAKVTQRERTMTAFDKAFEACFSVVDRNIRTVTNEQILWIADRSDRNRESATKASLMYHRFKEATFTAGGLIFGQMGMPLKAGYSRIADTVYFGSSHESVALQLADVCCSTITLYLLEQHYGWNPVVEPYYDIIRPAILNHGTPVMFRRSRSLGN